jgi:hypothetical protein
MDAGKSSATTTHSDTEPGFVGMTSVANYGNM